MLKKLLLCLGLLWGLPAGLAAQPAFYFRHLTTRHGLSYNLVNCLYEDREGYLWVGTANGLNRYDGSRFVVFKNDPADPHSLAHNNVISLGEDRQGHLWAATTGGMSRYDKTTNAFTSYLLEPRAAEDFLLNEVTNLLCDRRGTVWATSTAGFYEFIPAEGRFKSYKHQPANPASLSSNHIPRNSLVEDPELPLLWMGTRNGLNCFDTERKVFYNYRNNPQQLPVFIDDEAFPVALDRQNRLVFGDYRDDKLVTYSLLTGRVTYADDVVTDNYKGVFTNLTTLFFDAGNNLWASAWHDKQMVHYREAATSGLHPVRHDEANPASIGSDFFWDALQTKDGTLYLGGTHGISVYNPAATFYRVHEPSAQFPQLDVHTVFKSLVEDGNGTLWLGNDGQGLFSYDFTRNAYRHFSLPGTGEAGMLANKVQHLAYIGGEIWVSTLNGLYRFHPATGTFRSFDPLPESERAPQTAFNWCYQDRQGDVWFGVNWKWVGKYAPAGGTFTRYNFDAQFIDSTRTTWVKAVAEDPQGDLWFGTHSGRLYRYHPGSGRVTPYAPRFKQSLGAVPHPISDLKIDEQGIVWMATEGSGLARFDPARNTFRNWRESDGLGMDVVKTLLIDLQGRIWAGSYEGATLFDPQRGAVIDSRLDYGQRENNFRSAGNCRLRDGRFVYANHNNFIVLDPARITRRHDKPRPVVSGITIFEKLRPLYRHTRAIGLSYRENFFTVDFSALAGLPGTAVEYAYRLEPYDRNWVSGVSRNFATYTGVRGGTYAFQVKARYKDGAWSEPARLTIRVRPPYWETWWFRAAAGTGLALLVVYVARTREKRLVREGREKSELRERIAGSEMKALRSQMNPHFLYNSLNAIRLFILRHDSDNAEKYLVKFARLMRLILDNSQQEWVSLASELEQLQLYLELESLRFDGKFDFRIQTDPHVSPGAVGIPPMIIQPFIENAILHGIAHKPGPGCITVLFQKTPDGLTCTVDDDGVGRQHARALESQSLMPHQSVGVQVTEERLRLIGLGSGKKAGIAIIDKLDDANRPAGTRVVIELPLADA